MPKKSIATLKGPRNRVYHFTKEQVEEQLIQMLGMRHIIWLGDGLQDDQRGGQRR